MEQGSNGACLEQGAMCCRGGARLVGCRTSGERRGGGLRVVSLSYVAANEGMPFTILILQEVTICTGRKIGLRGESLKFSDPVIVVW